MGDYDLPALINKTLQVSGQEQLFYTGHSMGTTAFLVMANKHPGKNPQ
jgi:S-formylglutathione hydrolase FrmB